MNEYYLRKRRGLDGKAEGIQKYKLAAMEQAQRCITAQGAGQRYSDGCVWGRVGAGLTTVLYI